MSITITLTPAEERKLSELAQARGKDLASHAHDVVAAYLNTADRQSTKTFEEILRSRRRPRLHDFPSDDDSPGRAGRAALR